MADAISMRWTRDAKGYDLEEKVIVIADSAGSVLERPAPFTAVVARGDPVNYEVSNQALWDLVNMLRHPDDVMEFVGKWGLLSSRGQMEPLSSILNHMKHIQQAAKLAEEKQWARLEKMVGQQIKPAHPSGPDDEARGVRLNLRYARVPGHAEPHLFLEPVNLISYCWIELMQRAAGARLMRCEKCGRLFPADEGEGARPTKRKYCSPKCRLAAHRHGL